MKSSITFLIISCLLMFFLSDSVNALNRDAESRQAEVESLNNTSVTSETLDFNMKTSVLAYMDNVTATNSQYTLKCNTLLISLDKDNKPVSMQAKGNVNLKVKDGEITCKKATYSRSSGEFILEQNVKLHQANSTFSADKIKVLIKDGRFEGIHGEGNIKGSFPLDEVLQNKKSINSDED
jgi:lipopolysaccharide transport protein LptA